MSNPMLLLPVTQWFEGTPPAPGVWEVTSDDSSYRLFQWWDGYHWGVRGYSPRDAMDWSVHATRFPPAIYRGLAEDPNTWAKP